MDWEAGTMLSMWRKNILMLSLNPGRWLHQIKVCIPHPLHDRATVWRLVSSRLGVWHARLGKWICWLLFQTSTSILGGTSPPGSYTQNMPPRSAASGLPPILPPLLQQTVLNQDQPYVRMIHQYLRPAYIMYSNTWTMYLCDILVLETGSVDIYLPRP